MSFCFSKTHLFSEDKIIFELPQISKKCFASICFYLLLSNFKDSDCENDLELLREKILGYFFWITPYMLFWNFKFLQQSATT